MRCNRICLHSVALGLVVLLFALASRIQGSTLPKIVFVDPYWAFEHDPDATVEQKNAYYHQLDSLGITHVAGTADSNTTNNGVGLIYTGTGGSDAVWQTSMVNLRYAGPPYSTYTVLEAENETPGDFVGYGFLQGVGRSVLDPNASHGEYWQCDPAVDTAGMAVKVEQGPYWPRLVFRYKTWLSFTPRMRVSSYDSSAVACTVKVWVDTGGVSVLRNIVPIVIGDYFDSANVWRDIPIPFYYITEWAVMRPEIIWTGTVTLDIDKISLSSGIARTVIEQLPYSEAEEALGRYFAWINPAYHSHFMLHEYTPCEYVLGKWWNDRSEEVLPGHPAIGVLNWESDFFLHDVPTPRIEPFSYPFKRHTDSATTESWNSVQSAFDVFTFDQATQASNAAASGADRWFYIQVQSEWHCAADTVILRDPQPNEITAEAMLALAYGCRGIGYFLYPSLTCDGNAYFDPTVGLYQPTNMMSSDKSQPEMATHGLVDWDWENKRYVPNYKYNVVMQLNSRMDSLWTTLEDLEWSGAGGGDSVHSITGSVIDSIQSLSFEGNPWVEFGFFTDAQSNDYFMMVNRRVLASEMQTVRSWIDRDPGMYYVIDLYSYDTVLTGSLASGDIPFTTSLPAGEAKLFKTVPVGASTVAGHMLPQTWQGGIAVGGNVTVDSNRSLTILGPAEIRVTSGSGYSLQAYGPITVEGTESNPVRFRSSNVSNPGFQDWAGIRHRGPGNLTFKHVAIQDGYRGLWVLNTTSADTISIDSCIFEHDFLAGIQNDRDTLSLVSITNSRFADMYSSGIYVYRGHVEIEGCEFRGNLINGISIEAGNARPTAGQIKNCSFDSLTSPSAIGVYLSMIKNHSTPSDVILQSNTFGPHWPIALGNTQTAIYVNNCIEVLHLNENRVDGDYFVDFRPLYAIANYSTSTFIEGNYDEPSAWIDSAQYGVFCLSSGANDTDYAHVRATKFVFCKHGVYVYYNAKVDLDGSELPNAFAGFTDYYQRYSVYNLNDSFTVPAQYNSWRAELWPGHWPYTYGPVDTSHPLGYDPFGQGDGLARRVSLEGSAALSTASSSYMLEGNYPNPFNTSTVVSFALAEASRTEIVVYNVLGQRIRGLLDDDLSEGPHQLTWDGRDDAGQLVASGVYFYRLKTNQFHQTRKMVVVK